MGAGSRSVVFWPWWKICSRSAIEVNEDEVGGVGGDGCEIIVVRNFAQLRVDNRVEGSASDAGTEVNRTSPVGDETVMSKVSDEVAMRQTVVWSA